ncbi:MAG TPA: hypothetical protein P5150_08255 [Candidatus Ratteibacteria bacterium]|nr:hypothetical protein [Candidatus Ratteibacteria bacterium]
MTDEKLVCELEMILSELQLLDIRLANVVEYLHQQISKEIEKKVEEET